VQAGIRLHDLNHQLEKLGLSLENLGAACEQSIAGATATGTHGTGRVLGNMATKIEGMRLVLANGTVIEASKKVNTDIFDAARVGLGCLGVISTLTIRTLPLFKLRLTNMEVRLDDLLEQLPVLMLNYQRLQWFWLPPDENRATLVLREVTEEPISPVGHGEEPGGCWDTTLVPHNVSVPPAIFGSMPVANVTTCVDVSYKAMCGSSKHYAARHLYTEMEMFIPARELTSAIGEFRDFQASVLPQHDPKVPLFTGVRYVDGDDILLSTANGRETAVMSMIVMGTSQESPANQVEFQRYAGAMEKITAAKYGGRPHWGKQNWATASTLIKL